jgi:hypothetical protein
MGSSISVDVLVPENVAEKHDLLVKLGNCNFILLLAQIEQNLTNHNIHHHVLHDADAVIR